MEQCLMTASSPQPTIGRLLVGLDAHLGSLNLAILHPHDAGFPGTDDLHRIRSLRSFERLWNSRFLHPSQLEAELRPIVVVSATDYPGLLLWLETCGNTVCALQDVDLQPFRKTAVEYDIPVQFRRAYALALCVATRLYLRRDLQALASTINELHFHLQDAERTLWRLAAAYGANPLGDATAAIR